MTLWIRCGQLHIKRFNEPVVCACAEQDRPELFFFFCNMLRLRGGNERGRKVGGGGVDVIIISLYKKPGGQKVDEQEVAEMQPALWCSEERVE